MSDSSGARRRTYQVKSVVKAIQILRSFSATAGELSLTDLCARTGEHKAVVFRLVRTLQDAGFLQQDPGTKRYRIGAGAFEVGALYRDGLSLERIAQSPLKALASEHGHTAFLLVLDGWQGVVVAAVEGSNSMRSVARPGERRHLHCTASGKVLLAGMPDAEIQRFLDSGRLPRLASATVTDPARVWKEVRAVRQRGYASTRNESSEGISSVGAPVLDAAGRTVAAISVAYPTGAVSAESFPALAGAVVETARQISNRWMDANRNTALPP